MVASKKKTDTNLAQLGLVIRRKLSQAALIAYFETLLGETRVIRVVHVYCDCVKLVATRDGQKQHDNET